MEAPKCKICGDRHYGLCSAPKAEAKRGAAGMRAKVETGKSATAQATVRTSHVTVGETAPVLGRKGKVVGGLIRASDLMVEPRSEMVISKAMAESLPKPTQGPAKARIAITPSKDADGKFDRMAYQREYMREWRKRQKGKSK
jgi:hypothetical protein